jgi:UDP-glucose 4-epimerase
VTQRVLVTGGAGFIGSHVAEAYLSAGFRVTVVDDLSSGVRTNVPAGAEFVEHDINAPEVRALLAHGGFSILNHHAAQMDVRVSVADPLRDARINLFGLLNLLEGARAGGIKRVVFASSGGVVYGERGQLPHPESAAKLPVSPYGVSKLASEYYLAAYAQLHGIGAVALRYANVYGPRQNPHGEAGVVAIFCSRVTRGESLTIYGDGEQTRDYVFVGDVARANLAATTCALPTLDSIDAVAVNIGTSREVSVLELAATIQQAAGRKVAVTHAEARPGELKRSSVANAKAATMLNWQPAVDLAGGLAQTFRWTTEVLG